MNRDWLDCFNADYDDEWTTPDADTWATDDLFIAHCKNQYADWDDTDEWWQNADKYYYERGFGLFGLEDSEEYSEFSKAVFGDEWTLADTPEIVFTYNGEDEDFQVLPLAILFWRHMQSYHSGLPSTHDLVTGFFEVGDDL